MITDDCPNLIAELPKLKWKKWASVRVAEQNNKLEDIRDKDNHCYDALKYAMTFMEDLTPEQLSGKEPGSFKAVFGERFRPTEKFKEYDDQDEWGSGWQDMSPVRSLEGY